VLVLGAGAIGGYFGGRLLAAGGDVTFLVRPDRQIELATFGLQIRSPKGDVDLPDPPMVTAPVDGRYDLVLLACKGYDLEGALDAIAPAVGDHTLILPLLNGMRHVDVLAQRFGREKVLGGLCMISATLDATGRVVHLPDLGPLDLIVFGELDGGITPRVEAVRRELGAAGFGLKASEDVLQEMWEKWIFLAAGAGINCLMRGAMGDIVEAGGSDLSRSLLAETSAIAAASGHAPRREVVARLEPPFTDPGSNLTASLLRDLEHGTRVEADHILGDLLRRAPEPEPRSLLRIAYVHLKTYEVRRGRESATGSGREVAVGVQLSEEGL
jgi:2-dehydropantoate 2-reductase